MLEIEEASISTWFVYRVLYVTSEYEHSNLYISEDCSLTLCLEVIQELPMRSYLRIYINGRAIYPTAFKSNLYVLECKYGDESIQSVYLSLCTQFKRFSQGHKMYENIRGGSV